MCVFCLLIFFCFFFKDFREGLALERLVSTRARHRARRKVDLEFDGIGTQTKLMRDQQVFSV